MHPDEIENLGDGYNSESQRCYAEAQMLLERKNERNEAYTLARAGRFVVFCVDEVCCRATDALVGVSEYISSHHATREEAEKACGEESAERHIITPDDVAQADERARRMGYGSEVRTEIGKQDECPF